MGAFGVIRVPVRGEEGKVWIGLACCGMLGGSVDGSVRRSCLLSALCVDKFRVLCVSVLLVVCACVCVFVRVHVFLADNENVV